jgi:hypothetical protein
MHTCIVDLSVHGYFICPYFSDPTKATTLFLPPSLLVIYNSLHPIHLNFYLFPLNMDSLIAGQAHVELISVILLPSRDSGAQWPSVLFFEWTNKVNKTMSLGFSEGEILGPALAENTGLTELNISWNHLRGLGTIVFAKGLEV